MKTIALILVVLGMILLSAFKKVDYYKHANLEKQKQIDSMKVLLFDLQRDSIVYKMLTDYSYRTRVQTLAKTIPDEDLVKLVNKYSIKAKGNTSKKAFAAKSRKKQKQNLYRTFSYNNI